MPLTDDQRAMLQLMLQRGQSYDDIASLLGLGVDEVRSRARAALREIGGEDPDQEVGLTDYLLGQADPIGRADAARHLQSDPATRDLADRLLTQLRVLAPGAELPGLPDAGAAPVKRSEAAAKPSGAPAPGSVPSTAPTEAPPARRPLSGLASDLSRRQRQVIAALVGAGIVVLFAVLALTGVFGGNGDEETSASTDQGSGQNAGNASGLTRAVLSSRGESAAEGVAVFARVRQQPVLQVNVTGLERSGSGEAYVIWLYGGPNSAFPLVRQRVGENGQLRGAAPVPAQLIQALQQGLFDSIDVSRARNSEISAALRQARRSQRLPRYAGRSVARGPITGPGFPAGDEGSGSSG